MDLGAGLLAIFVGVIVKSAVMLLSGWLVVNVYRASQASPPRRLWLLLPKRDTPTVRLLWWGLVLFFVSELTCGIEVYVLFQSSVILSTVHALTSASGMGLFALGLMRLIDDRILRLDTPGCAARGLCQPCTRSRQRGCKFRALSALLGSLVGLVSLLPMFASTDRMVADVRKFMLPFPALNGWYDAHLVPWLSANVPNYEPTGTAYFIPSEVLWVEFRVIPIVALGLAVISVWCSVRGALVSAMRWMASAVGVLGYVFLELVTYRGMGDVLLASLAHELAEFWFLLFTAELLRQLFPGDARVVRSTEPSSSTKMPSAPVTSGPSART